MQKDYPRKLILYTDKPNENCECSSNWPPRTSPVRMLVHRWFLGQASRLAERTGAARPAGGTIVSWAGGRYPRLLRRRTAL